jgi:hypothetical protein
VRAFLPGAFLWLAGQVVTSTGLQVSGNVRVQAVIAAASVVAVGVCSGVALWLHAPLWVVALAASGGTTLTWAGGVIALERLAPNDAPRRSAALGIRALLLSALASALVMAHWNILAATLLDALGALAITWPALDRVRRGRGYPRLR